MKVLYILATLEQACLGPGDLEEGLEAEELDVAELSDGEGFTVTSDGQVVEIRFERLDEPLGWTPGLLTGGEAAHHLLRSARSVYRLAVDAGGEQPTVAVFEALWCARALMEKVGGVLLDVTAYKLHEPDDVQEMTELEFDVRDHVTLHAVEWGEGDVWIHSHGMEKFGARDVETFHLSEEDLPAAENFLHQLCTDLAFAQGPAPGALVETGEGDGFMLQPSEEARPKLLGVGLDVFEQHEGPFFTVVSADGRHTVAEVLAPYRGRFAGEDPEISQALLEQAQGQLPAFKARFLRKGLMEPTQFLVRGRFETHPDPEKSPVQEDLWAEVVAWDEESLVAKLVDGSSHTTEWRRGVQVELAQDQVNALAVAREGRALDPTELASFLGAELPS
ncbi:MAG: hypothetical protein RL653_3461 [Pseudomonadota bacterium]